jgi:hypothetical protein
VSSMLLEDAGVRDGMQALTVGFADSTREGNWILIPTSGGVFCTM